MTDDFRDDMSEYTPPLPFGYCDSLPDPDPAEEEAAARDEAYRLWWRANYIAAQQPKNGGYWHEAFTAGWNACRGEQPAVELGPCFVCGRAFDGHDTEGLAHCYVDPATGRPEPVRETEIVSDWHSFWRGAS